MELLTDWALDTNPEKWVEELRQHCGSCPYDADTMQELVTLFHDLAQPRAMFGVAYVEEKTEDTVRLDSQLFRSRILRHNLEQAQKVFPYVVTIGGCVEEYLNTCADMLQQYYLESMADVALERLHQDLEHRLEQRFGFTQLSSMSPGSLGNWPIDQQQQLFSLLGNTEATVGVRLTDSYLMLPRKSISGVFFATERKFYSCQLCPRVNCLGRKAPFNKNLARQMDPLQ